MKDILSDSNNISESPHRSNFELFLNIISQYEIWVDREKMFRWYEWSREKPRIQKRLLLGRGDQITLSIVKNNYICAHYNCADLPMLNDFDEIKPKLSIVNKSFVTLGKPLRIYNSLVYLRDTILLAPIGKGKLEDLGKLSELEGDYSKRVVSSIDKAQMSKFLKRDKEAFEEYAIIDAKITLRHAVAMELFNMSIKQIGIPITLSSIGRIYDFEEWRTNFQKYLPYQISGKCLMANPDEAQTPKGFLLNWRCCPSYRVISMSL